MSADLLRRLIEAGTPAELVAEVAMLAGEAAALEKRRAADRERQRNYRNNDVTLDNVTSRDSADVTDKSSPLEVSPQTPLPKTPSKTAPLNPPKFMEAWNGPAKRHGLPTIQSIAGDRLRSLKRRIAEHGEQAVFDAIAAVFRAPHWLGVNGWLGNFDSMLRPANFVRLIEGTYCGKSEVQRVTDPKVLAANKRATADLYDKMGRTAEASELRNDAEQLEQRAAA